MLHTYKVDMKSKDYASLSPVASDKCIDDYLAICKWDIHEFDNMWTAHTVNRCLIS